MADLSNSVFLTTNCDYVECSNDASGSRRVVTPAFLFYIDKITEILESLMLSSSQSS